MRPIGEIIEAAHAEAAVLRQNKAGMAPERFEQYMREVENATVGIRDWMTEPDAMLRSARPQSYFRRHFPEWMRQGLARYNPDKPRERQYLKLIVPLRANTGVAREAGRRGLRMAASV